MDTTLTNFGPTHFGDAPLGHRRRTQRLVRVAERVAAHPNGSLPQKMQDPAELAALDHLMNRPEVTHAAVLHTHYQRTRAAIAAHPGVVLLGHDLTELDKSGKLSLRDQVGPLSGKNQHGYLCHNRLAATTAGEPLGLTRQILHPRRRRAKKTTRAAQRDDPQRETRRWIRGREACGDFPGQRVVDRVDRGGDTFEFLDYEDVHGYHDVARSQSNRNCRIGHEEPGASVLLHDYLRALPPVSRRPIEVPAAPARHGPPARSARSAEVALSFAAVTLVPPSPSPARGQHRQEPLRVWAFLVGEVAAPPGGEALEWLLLSNVAVPTTAEGWERVDWYEWRWPLMEEYHQAQKTGCDLEGPQFTTAAAMAPMIGLLSVVAWRLLYLRWAAAQPEAAEQLAVEYVPESWVVWLSRWRCGVERRDGTVREFFLALARLGGHQNRKGDGLPGWQTLWKGWTKLRTVIEFADLHSG